MSNDGNDDCYWYQQGKCFLYEIPESWVFEFLAQSPKAREDLLECGGNNKCPFVDPDWKEFAESGVTVQDAIQRNEDWKDFATEFVDRHRQIKAGKVFNEPQGDDE